MNTTPKHTAHQSPIENRQSALAQGRAPRENFQSEPFKSKTQNSFILVALLPFPHPQHITKQTPNKRKQTRNYTVHKLVKWIIPTVLFQTNPLSIWAIPSLPLGTPGPEPRNPIPGFVSENLGNLRINAKVRSCSPAGNLECETFRDLWMTLRSATAAALSGSRCRSVFLPWSSSAVPAA